MSEIRRQIEACESALQTWQARLDTILARSITRTPAEELERVMLQTRIEDMRERCIGLQLIEALV